MELFDRPFNINENLLPGDGAVIYYGKIFNKEMSTQLFATLLEEIDWQSDQAKIFGKTYITKRKVAWYGEKHFPYRYSGTTKVAQLWTETLETIKEQVEGKTGEVYNSCLLNLYHDGAEGMAWHSDGEKELKRNGSIASVSLGAERKFSFKHKETKEKIDTWLESGSLLEMKGVTQTYWLHRLPPTKKVLTPRVNLTFRQMDLHLKSKID